jgi:cysteine desulfurase/selenocysteine lyase
MAAAATGARLVVAPLDERGQLREDIFESLLGERTRLVAMAHVSNVLGTVLPVQRIVAAARRRGIPVLFDGAQAVAHEHVDVRALDCDFYCFSGHKLYGPTGIGVLYGRERLLEAMPPWQGGGSMIHTVSFESSTWADLPLKCEAGTPNISGAIGLAAAMDILKAGPGRSRSRARPACRCSRGTGAHSESPARHGSAQIRRPVIPLDGVHPHDLGTVLDHEGVAIRAGHHCAMPLMGVLGVPATARASFACYSTHAEVAQLEQAVIKARKVFT